MAAATLPLLPARPNQTSGAASGTATPIKYVVVIFDENNSFDHYFGTYPNALYPNGVAASAQNPYGESPFVPLPNTPSINGLSPALNGVNSTGPFRLDRSQETTCDNDNHCTDEQKAYNLGLLNLFPESTSATGSACTPALGMDYYDGNTVTALWNYAQYFAMSGNFFDSELTPR
jgi:phospholipase C